MDKMINMGFSQIGWGKYVYVGHTCYSVFSYY
jgi:hypothetical protein